MGWCAALRCGAVAWRRGARRCVAVRCGGGRWRGVAWRGGRCPSLQRELLPVSVDETPSTAEPVVPHGTVLVAVPKTTDDGTPLPMIRHTGRVCSCVAVPLPLSV